jgi:hypothetical protein
VSVLTQTIQSKVWSSIVKREVISFKIPRPKHRADFLFNDGEFKPKSEKIAKAYRRREKHRNQSDYEDRFYL